LACLTHSSLPDPLQTNLKRAAKQSSCFKKKEEAKHSQEGAEERGVVWRIADSTDSEAMYALLLLQERKKEEQYNQKINNTQTIK
jgi:hypothetical protein